METASSSAPGTSYSYHTFSLAQAVLTLSVNALVLCFYAVIKPSSSSSNRRAPAACTAGALPPPPPERAPAPATATAAAGAVDMDVVLGVMGAGAAASVGFEEAAALFEEEEATVEEACEAFAVFDRDGDGFIDAAELGSVLGSLGFSAGVAAAECQRMIDAYDEDKDGRIDFHEFVKLMESSH